MNAQRTAAILATAALASTCTLAVAPAEARPSAPKPTAGWSAVTLQPTGKPRAAQQLVLVSPTGKQYPVARVGANAAVVDISNDGRRILYTDWAGRRVYRVIDVRSKKVTVVGGVAGKDVAHVRFTQPSGTALLVRTMDMGVPNTGWVHRTDLTGRSTVRYARTANSNYLTQSPDGLFLVTQNARFTLQVNGNKGSFLRTLPSPKGYTDCRAGHWTGKTQFTAVCHPVKGTATQVFRFDVRGRKPVALTAGLPTKGRDVELGYQDLWRTPAGTVVAKTSGCGAPVMAKVSGSRLRTLPVGGETAAALALTGTRITFAPSGGCESPMTTLKSHDLRTGRTTLLAGGTANRGMAARSAVTLDPTR